MQRTVGVAEAAPSDCWSGPFRLVALVLLIELSCVVNW